MSFTSFRSFSPSLPALLLLLSLPAAAERPAPGRAVNGNPNNEVFLSNESLSGWLLDNEGNAGHDGGGFNLLSHADYPGRSFFRDHMVGLNFEHIFNGATDDKDISMFTPRREPNILIKHPDKKSATLRWEAEQSSWKIDCAMTYSFAEADAIDMKFSATPRQEKWPLGYLAFMWASYMGRSVERPIHFWGTDGKKEGWMAWGEETDDAQGFETGTVAYVGMEPLPYEAESQTLNIVEHPKKQFLLPFYYGLLDGDHDLNSTGDRLAYIVMFDQTAPIRFALWNFIKDADGKPDPHSPAWDWQFVIHDPVVGKAYGYRMRVVVEPFTSPEAVLARYRAWAEAP